MAKVSIGKEAPADCPAIAALIEAAFGRADEARLVERLRADGDLVLSLVARTDHDIVGHIALSRMRAPFAALGLAPLTVAPGHRDAGIGRQLIERATEFARRDGWVAIFVLGEPTYYRRFGFDADAAAGFTSPYSGRYLMVLNLGDAPLPATAGAVDYAPAFGAL